MKSRKDICRVHGVVLIVVNLIMWSSLLAISLSWHIDRASEYLGALWSERVPLIGMTDSIDRTAIASWGKDFYNFLTFLRGNIPENATVIIQPGYDGGYEVFSYRSLTQYYLFPRDVQMCRYLDQDSCPELYGKDGAYVLFQGGIHQSEMLPGYRLHLYSSDLGLFIP